MLLSKIGDIPKGNIGSAFRFNVNEGKGPCKLQYSHNNSKLVDGMLFLSLLQAADSINRRSPLQFSDKIL